MRATMPELLRTIPRNVALLVTLVFLIIVAPLVPVERSGFVAELLFDLVLVAGVFSVRPKRRSWAFLAVTTVTLAARWGEILSGAPGLDVAALALTVVWIGYAVSIIVIHLFRRREVTLDTIMGAVVSYLLVAFGFAMLFEILALQNPDAFSGLPEATSGRRKMSDTLLYFSLVCITTMGYGDVVPTSDLARPLAALEGVFGQLYLAVMIARLVGLHLAAEHQS